MLLTMVEKLSLSTRIQIPPNRNRLSNGNGGSIVPALKFAPKSNMNGEYGAFCPQERIIEIQEHGK